MTRENEIKILAVDTGGKVSSVSILENEREIDSRTSIDNKISSKNLIWEISEILENNGLRLTDIDLLAVLTGPGSYTGLKVGLSSVKGLVFGTGIKTVGICYSEALAYLRYPEKTVRTLVSNNSNEILQQIFYLNNGSYSAKVVSAVKCDFKSLSEVLEQSPEIPTVCDKLIYDALINIQIGDVMLSPPNTATIIGQAAFHKARLSCVEHNILKPVYS